jgi:hypothetical protein
LGFAKDGSRISQKGAIIHQFLAIAILLIKSREGQGLAGFAHWLCLFQNGDNRSLGK